MYGKDRSGIPRSLRVNESGQLSGVSNLTEAAINGRLFHTCSQASSTTSATGTEAHVGLLVGNPPGSGKYLVMHEFGWAADGEIADESTIGLATGAIGNMALVAAPVIQPSLVGSAFSSVAYADQAGVTAGTLTIARICAEADDDGAGGSQYGSSGPNIYNINGSIVLAPGYVVGTDSELALGDVMWFHFQWEEIDII